MDWLQENIFTVVSTLFGGSSLIGYFTERSKRKIAEKKEASDALKSMQDAYNEFTKDYLEKYTQLKAEIDSLKENLAEVHATLSLERERYKNLEEEYLILKKKDLNT